MSSRKIQRGIQSRHARRAGDAPLIGKISKVHRTTDADGRLSGLLGSYLANSANRRGILAFSVVFGVVSLGVLIAFVFLWFRSRQGVVAVGGSPPAIHDRIESKFQSPSEDEAVALVRRALAIRDEADIPAVIRPGKASPAEITGFLDSLTQRDGELNDVLWLGSMDGGDHPIDGVLVSFTKGETTNARLALLVPDDQGVWRMDFDAFARTCRPSWRELHESVDVEAEVRVFISRYNYFNGPFADESKWVCYAMISPDTAGVIPEEKGILCGYCKVGSPQAKAMARVLDKDAQVSRATLVIRRRPSSDGRQFEIVRVLARDWALGEQPLDSRFQ